MGTAQAMISSEAEPEPAGSSRCLSSCVRSSTVEIAAMPRYVAFLRGVSPMNLKMPVLKACLEKAGFEEVKTVLSSGNVAFNSTKRSTAALEQQIEKALQSKTKRTFFTVVRSVAALQEMVESDPFQRFKLPPNAKRVVTFARSLSRSTQKLPIKREGAQILVIERREAYSAYVPSPQGPVFMELIKSTFGDEVTTRTWDTVKKCANA